MSKIKESNRLPFLLTPLGLILANCGGGGSSSGSSGQSVSQDPPINTPQNQSFNVGGNVVKGPLSNALVFLDYDDDGVQDADEPSIRTDADGGYSISTTNATYSVVAIADDSTIDTSSGTVLTGVTLKAPKGASVITPTTTLMKESNLTAEDVASVLSLPDGVDPLTFIHIAPALMPQRRLLLKKLVSK